MKFLILKNPRAILFAACFAAVAQRSSIAHAQPDNVSLPAIPKTTCLVVMPGVAIEGWFDRDPASNTEVKWTYDTNSFFLYQADFQGMAVGDVNDNHAIHIFHYPFSPLVYVGSNPEPLPPNTRNWNIAVSLAKSILDQCPKIN